MNTQNVATHVVNWLTRYLEKSGMKGFTIGVSGGIDSAVTSTLCAMTGKKVLVLNMPIFQARDQVARSSDHINWLKSKHDNVEGVDMDLTCAFREIQAGFPHEIQDDLTMANTRSRLRMLTLYAFAGHHRMLVAGTGNKVEDFGVGFYTKYGDGGVDISPIADLMKSEVYALGQYLGVSKEILSAPPTDGLWEDGRTDESQIGASYEELEWAMAREEKNDKKDMDSQDPRPLNNRQKQVLSIFRKLHTANRHKMDPIPVCKIPKGLKDLP